MSSLCEQAVESDVYLEIEKHLGIVLAFVAVFRWKKKIGLLSFFKGKSSVDVIVCLEIGAERDSRPIRCVAGSRFVLYSSSHSGSLASGAIWLSSTLWRYWCLAMKYCMH